MITCKVCGNKIELKSLARHFYLQHQVGLKSRFLCGAKDCNISFSCQDRFEKHYAEFHPITQELRSSRAKNTSCDSKELWICQFPNCSFTSSNSKTLQSHNRRLHRGSSLVGNSPKPNDNASHIVPSCSSGPPDPPMSGTNDSIDDASFFNISESLNEPRSTPDLPTEDDLLKSFAHLFLTLDAKHHIAETTLQYIIEKYYFLLNLSQSAIKANLLTELKCQGLNEELSKELAERVLKEDVALKIHSPRGPMRSAHMRKKQFTKLFSYVPPKGFKLGLNGNNKQRAHHYVPIRETLNALLSDDSVYKLCFETQKPTDPSKLSDINDGSLVRKHSVFSTDPTAIQLLLYEDDVELASALGSARGKFKLNMFYYTLGNLPSWCRLKIDLMQVVMLTRTVDMKYFGMRKVLTPLINELKDLQKNGIEVRGRKLKVELLSIHGDNLGQNIISCLPANFSRSEYFCRFCEEPRSAWLARWNLTESEEDEIEADGDGSMEDSDDDSDVNCSDHETDACAAGNGSHSNAVEEPNCPVSEYPMRTPASYSKCLEYDPKDSSAKGVYEDSIFNEIENFHVTGATPPCLAHDLFEGIVDYDLYLALNYFDRKFNISKESINRKFESFKFIGEDALDKPARVPAKGKKLTGHAVQNWVFLRFLPVIIGSKINDKNDPVWRMVLLLIEIVRFVVSPCIRRTSLPGLRSKIADYLTIRCTIFVEPLRPKHHFMEHYPDLILVFGPLMRVSTLRYESKHTFFRNVVRGQRNFRNITKTLAEKHSLFQSALSVSNLIPESCEMEEGVPFLSIVLDEAISEKIKEVFGYDTLERLMCSEKLTWQGNRIVQNHFVVLESGQNELHLCKVAQFVSSGPSVYVVGRKCRADLLPDLQVFAVSKSEGVVFPVVVVPIQSIADIVGYPPYDLEKNSILVPKHSN